MKTASLLLTLQLVASLWLSSASGLVCSPNQYAWTGHCCSRCPAGTHMQSRCTSTKDTLCRSCLQEIEYNPEWNTKYQCESCRQCVNQFIYKRHCNLTTDSQCLCIAGKRCWDEGCTRCITDIPASTPDAGVPTATEKEQHTWPVQKREGVRETRQEKQGSVQGLASQTKDPSLKYYRHKKQIHCVTVLKKKKGMPQSRRSTASQSGNWKPQTPRTDNPGHEKHTRLHHTATR
uniref:CD27 antigen-like isoform X2 n=1 Tax=Geotrypetes seraphini TaxID=260995 RepID=A0A6P8P6T4_GEOSA|nr:CD27 antigen-like isoform X2 [Geotrypetes seraphini]